MKLSVITINFNNRDGLRKTIESVVNQTYKDFEYIIIDGGSTDGSVDVIKEYADRIDYWVSEPDKGIYNAMNKGIDVAKGEYCIFMNSGDCFYNLSVLSDVLPSLDGKDVIAGTTVLSDGRIYAAPERIALSFLYFETLCHQSSFIRTDMLRKYKYDEDYKIAADYKFLLQTLIVDNCAYGCIKENVAIYDISGASSVNEELLMKERELAKNEVLPDYLLYDLKGSENEFYMELKKRKFHKKIYKLNVLLIKILSLFKGKGYWINKYPLDI